MKYGLSDEQLQEIITFISNYSEVEEAVLFGSRAIDTYKEASDVDIALKGEKVSFSLAAKLKFDIEEDTYLPFFFDFIAYPIIDNQALLEHIDTKGVPIYRKGWREVMLQDLVSILGDGLHGTPIYDDNGEYHFINGNNLSNGRIIIKESTKKANKSEYEKYKKELNSRTILVSINGTVG